MYHYSYVFPRQVYAKTEYYKAVVSPNNIDNYFNRVYLPWVLGDDEKKKIVENEFNGVHEYHPSYRGACRTKRFNGEHPKVIYEAMEKLKSQFDQELSSYHS